MTVVIQAETVVAIEKLQLMSTNLEAIKSVLMNHAKELAWHIAESIGVFYSSPVVPFEVRPINFCGWGNPTPVLVLSSNPTVPHTKWNFETCVRFADQIQVNLKHLSYEIDGRTSEYEKTNEMLADLVQRFEQVIPTAS